MKTALLLCAVIGAALTKPNGYYHQEYNYKASSSSYKNNELQRARDDSGYYSKDGDLEGRVTPKIDSHSQHSEYVNPKLRDSGYYGSSGVAGFETDGYASSDRLFSQGIGSLGHSSGSFGQGAYGQSSGSYGQSSGSYGQSSGSYGQSSGSYGQSSQYVSGGLSSITQRLEQELSRQLHSAVYNQYQSSGYSNQIANSQLEANIRLLEDQLRSNVTRQLQQALQSQGSYNSGYYNQRYNSDEISRATQQLQNMLISKLREEVRTTYQQYSSSTNSWTDYATMTPVYRYATMTPMSYTTIRPGTYPSNIIYTPRPTITISEICTEVQKNLNRELDILLRDFQMRYITQNTYYTISDFDRESERIRTDLLRNLTAKLDEEIRRHYGQQVLRDNYYYSVFGGQTSQNYNYNKQDYDELRRQIESNLTEKLTSSIQNYRTTFTQYSNRPVISPSPSTGGYTQDFSELQRQLQEQLSRQLQLALSQYKQRIGAYSNYGSQDYQSSLQQLSRELQQNLTRQLNQFSASGSYGYSTSYGTSSAQIENIRSQVQAALMRQLQQALQQQFQYSSSYSSSGSASYGASGSYGASASYGSGSYGQYKGVPCCGQNTNRYKRDTPYTSFTKSSYHRPEVDDDWRSKSGSYAQSSYHGHSYSSSSSSRYTYPTSYSGSSSSYTSGGLYPSGGVTQIELEPEQIQKPELPKYTQSQLEFGQQVEELGQKPAAPIYTIHTKPQSQLEFGQQVEELGQKPETPKYSQLEIGQVEDLVQKPEKFELGQQEELIQSPLKPKLEKQIHLGQQEELVQLPEKPSKYQSQLEFGQQELSQITEKPKHKFEVQQQVEPQQSLTFSNLAYSAVQKPKRPVDLVQQEELVQTPITPKYSRLEIDGGQQSLDFGQQEELVQKIQPHKYSTLEISGRPVGQEQELIQRPTYSTLDIDGQRQTGFYQQVELVQQPETPKYSKLEFGSQQQEVVQKPSKFEIGGQQEFNVGQELVQKPEVPKYSKLEFGNDQQQQELIQKPSNFINGGQQQINIGQEEELVQKPEIPKYTKLEIGSEQQQELVQKPSKLVHGGQQQLDLDQEQLIQKPELPKYSKLEINSDQQQELVQKPPKLITGDQQQINLGQEELVQKPEIPKYSELEFGNDQQQELVQKPSKLIHGEQQQLNVGQEEELVQKPETPKYSKLEFGNDQQQELVQKPGKFVTGEQQEVDLGQQEELVQKPEIPNYSKPKVDGAQKPSRLEFGQVPIEQQELIPNLPKYPKVGEGNNQKPSGFEQHTLETDSQHISSQKPEQNFDDIYLVKTGKPKYTVGYDHSSQQTEKPKYDLAVYPNKPKYTFEQVQQVEEPNSQKPINSNLEQQPEKPSVTYGSDYVRTPFRPYSNGVPQDTNKPKYTFDQVQQVEEPNSQDPITSNLEQQPEKPSFTYGSDYVRTPFRPYSNGVPQVTSKVEPHIPKYLQGQKPVDGVSSHYGGHQTGYNQEEHYYVQRPKLHIHNHRTEVSPIEPIGSSHHFTEQNVLIGSGKTNQVSDYSGHSHIISGNQNWDDAERHSDNLLDTLREHVQQKKLSSSTSSYGHRLHVANSHISEADDLEGKSISKHDHYGGSQFEVDDDYQHGVGAQQFGHHHHHYGFSNGESVTGHNYPTLVGKRIVTKTMYVNGSPLTTTYVTKIGEPNVLPEDIQQELSEFDSAHSSKKVGTQHIVRYGQRTVTRTIYHNGKPVTTTYVTKWGSPDGTSVDNSEVDDLKKTDVETITPSAALQEASGVHPPKNYQSDWYSRDGSYSDLSSSSKFSHGSQAGYTKSGYVKSGYHR